MTIHAELSARIRADALKARPDLSAAQITAIIAKVAGLPRFRDSADFLTASLIDIVHADFGDIVRAVTVAHAAEPATAESARDPRDDFDAATWSRLHPTEKLKRAREAEEGREDIEGPAREARIENGSASALDRLTQSRTNKPLPTKADRKREPQVSLAGLDEIVNPAKRHEEWRRRVAASKSRQTLELERSALERRALDSKTDPATRAAANTELTRVVDALAKIGA